VFCVVISVIANSQLTEVILMWFILWHLTTDGVFFCASVARLASYDICSQISVCIEIG